MQMLPQKEKKQDKAWHNNSTGGDSEDREIAKRPGETFKSILANNTLPEEGHKQADEVSLGLGEDNQRENKKQEVAQENQQYRQREIHQENKVRNQTISDSNKNTVERIANRYDEAGKEHQRRRAEVEKSNT